MNIKNKFLWLCFLVLLYGCIYPARSDAVELSLKLVFAKQANQVVALASFTIPPDYHAYSHAPGDIGFPTTLAFTVPGESDARVLYPTGTESRDLYDSNVKTSIYSGTVNLLALIPETNLGKNYHAELSLLLCSNRHCLPHKETISGTIPTDVQPLASMSWSVVANDLLLAANPATTSASSAVSAAVLENPTSQSKSKSELSAAQQLDPFTPQFSPQYGGLGAEVESFAGALIFGFLAGLLLNAMPCVLPVLTLKVSGLLMRGTGRKQLHNFRRHSLCFVAGIMTFFTVLAFLLGVADLMWGQLYQNELIILFMLLLVFLMGLSMLGVFTLPMLDLNLGATTKNPWLKSYFTGLISTFLATPCSGPLLGGVLAWAFIQPLPVFMAVFWSVGAGMSLPYLIFSFRPRLARYLPRPGEWMLIFERIVGFLLLGTAIYLLSALPAAKHMRILCVLLAAGACAWLWGTFGGLSAPLLRRIAVGVASLAILGGGVVWTMTPAPPALKWQDFQWQHFSEQLGQKPIMLEFTADWCPNCKFLEATVLASDELRELQAQYGLVLIRVDLTRENGIAQKLLESLGSKSIPLTAIFPSGEGAHRPMVLRDIYSSSALREALENAFESGNLNFTPL